MELRAYSVRDSKGELFGPPFYQKTHGEAERSFKQLVSDPQSMPNKYPEDFDLYYLGNWDNSSGQFTPLDAPQHVLNAKLLANSSEIPKMKTIQ